MRIDMGGYLTKYRLILSHCHVSQKHQRYFVSTHFEIILQLTPFSVASSSLSEMDDSSVGLRSIVSWLLRRACDLRRRIHQNTAAATMRRTPRVTPTPIPAFAPVDRPPRTAPGIGVDGATEGGTT